MTAMCAARRSMCWVSSGWRAKPRLRPEVWRKVSAVAYALRPRLLLLDEPTSGVSTHEKAQIMDTVSSVVRGGMVTAVVIEHDMDVVFRYSDRIVMMHEGSFLADGTPDEIRANKEVANILLGAPLAG